MDTKEALYQYLLRLGDMHLILGQRMAEWCSKGPILEEDLAMTNFALDYFGQANATLAYAAQLKDDGTSADALAFRRSERGYYNYLLAEQPNGDFACTMMRQFFYSAFAVLQYEALIHSPDESLAAIATKGLKELRYHLRHSSEWVIRLGAGTAESHSRAQHALDELWPFTGNLFDSNAVDEALIDLDIITPVSELQETWQHQVEAILEQATLRLPETTYMQTGSLQAQHTEHLGHLLSEMQYLQRAYPDARW